MVLRSINLAIQRVSPTENRARERIAINCVGVTIHDKVESGGEEEETLRGASLRSLLEEFLQQKDSSRNYGGLYRLYDADGNALWTTLTDPDKIKEALEKRGEERRLEEQRRDEKLNDLLMKGGEYSSPADEDKKEPLDEMKKEKQNSFNSENTQSEKGGSQLLDAADVSEIIKQELRQVIREELASERDDRCKCTLM